MLSGRNQGYFGFTDFLYRPEPGSWPYRVVLSGAVRVPTLATLAAGAGLRAFVLGVPVNYPPVAIPGGVSLACFMAPSVERGLTRPAELQAELLAATSRPYLLDVVAERGDEADRGALAARLIEFDRQRFDVALHLVRTRPWDLLVMVCMGTDRVGHYFMRYQDPAHRRYPGEGPHSQVMLRQYQYCDRRLGELLHEAGPDTTVLVVSDHGMQRLDGRVHLNRWLIEQGYLRLERPADGPLPLRAARVDWEHTLAWATGYGGQLYLNVRGRGPSGGVPEERVDQVCRELADGLGRLPGPDGGVLRVTPYYGRDLFDGPHAALCPDLCLQFEGLRYLSSDRVDPGPLVEPIDAEGLDDGGHASAGFLAMAGPRVPPGGRFGSLHLLDVAPTILDLLGLPLPELDGQPVHRDLPESGPHAEEDALALTSRLRKLYLD
jgi:predicted AlkP superfamily phosphohydrolase/phosphomutase